MPLFAEYQAGLDAYNAGDYSTAMAEWKEAVSQQPDKENLAIYRESLYAIGMLYWQGEGVAQDYNISVVWLKQAADINHPGAQNKLGYLYSTGQGVPRNYQEAAKWLQMAAEQGDEDALHNLEILEETGLGDAGLGDADRPGILELPGAEGPAENNQPGPDLIPGSDAGQGWIAAQDPEHYTIQVIALRQAEKLHAFIADHPDWAPFAIYSQSRYQEPLWVLVQGAYAEVESARAARDVFPSGLQKQEDLWIRKFGMIQGLIE
jgi:TPR repeat protein